jgi:hypothetical protein
LISRPFATVCHPECNEGSLTKTQNPCSLW